MDDDNKKKTVFKKQLHKIKNHCLDWKYHICQNQKILKQIKNQVDAQAFCLIKEYTCESFEAYINAWKTIHQILVLNYQNFLCKIFFIL